MTDSPTIRLPVPLAGEVASRKPAAVVLVMLIALAGCKLIDQTTFAPSPSKNPQLLPVPPQPDRRTALITITQGTPIGAYRDLLGFAIRQAQARDPNVQFDVLVAVPGTGDTAAQTAALGSTQTEAVALLQEMQQDSVAPDHVHLRAGVDAALAQPQIRIYVR